MGVMPLRPIRPLILKLFAFGIRATVIRSWHRLLHNPVTCFSMFEKTLIAASRDGSQTDQIEMKMFG
ncbi:hypothetical protein PHAVU_004G101200 [Phaseolus vulgaris]|uniref:Uncharacterized protein n=1 Tax=Phaseolus vulgaris TaxID=3885 RepID=V7C3Y4_PHAVU|nr:hypothetical protein PHAVU_004G101200g [Phaseolus vulgaris]ESW24083.1 hypothetical protein PHAVU_004G101200g [Phaseolus vulgaris]